MQKIPRVGLSLMLEQAFADATMPLFQAGVVETLEWSFDVGWSTTIPKWAAGLLSHYSSEGQLIGHGVTFSALSAAWQPRQAAWLQQLHREVHNRSYQHVSEHFGFSTAGNFHQSAPLPVPRTAQTIAIGQDRLKRLADTCGCPIGLENLAFAFGRQDVHEQGTFLNELLDPVDGFLLLDLHNIYCQAANFQVDPLDLIDSYPLERVRELHVSGGSWSTADDGQQIRRDTHDDAVPTAVFDMLPDVLRRCPHIRYVILERLGNTLAGSEVSFQNDFRQLRSIVQETLGTETHS